jgi:hypothetical protein
MSSSYHYVDDPVAPRRPRWWIGYLVGSLCVLLGIIIPCGGVTGLLAAYSVDHATTIHPPVTAHITLEAHKRMVVWIEEPDDSASDDALAVPSDLAVTITGPDGKAVPASKPADELSSSTMNTERIGAYVFDPPASGDYAISVTGTLKPSQTIVVGPDVESRDAAFGVGFLALLLVGVVLVIGGLVTLIVTIVKHVKYQG